MPCIKEAMIMVEQIKECYDTLPTAPVSYGTSKESDFLIAQFEIERLKIATDCVFAALGINRITSQKM